MKPMRINSDAELHRAICARVAELDVKYEAIDEACRFAPGYASKLLSPRPVRQLSRMSLWAIIAVLGTELVFQEAPERIRKYADKLDRRRANTCLHSGVVIVQFSKRHMRTIGKKGGTNSRKKMSRRMASKLARKAVRARWFKAAKATHPYLGTPARKARPAGDNQGQIQD